MAGVKFLADLITKDALQFQTSGGTNAGKIEMDGDNLVLSNAVGDILFGDTGSNIYIGDGVNSVDILFEQSGSIRSEVGSNATLTLGSSDTTLNLYNPQVGNGMVLTSTMAINDGGSIDFTPNTGAFLKFDGQTILERRSANGAITFGHDDAVIIAGGDTSAVLNANNTASTETVVLGAEQGIKLYSFVDNDTTWANREQWLFTDKMYFGTAADTNLYRSAGSTLKTDDSFVVGGDFIKEGSGGIFKLYVPSWASGNQNHDVIYNAWNSSLGDYVYLKASGNSTGGHGAAIIGDDGFYVGRTNSESGAMVDSATAPLNADVWFYATPSKFQINDRLYIGTVDTNTSSTSALVLGTSNEVEKRTLGSNAFNSTTIPTNNNQLTNGADYLTTTSAASTYAPKASPALTGTPTAPTAAAATNTTQIATTAFVQTAVSSLIDSAPGTLDTLNELAAALGDDANFSTTVTNSIATKLPLAGGTLTGALTINQNGSALNLRSTTNSQPSRITFSSNVPASQIGHIEYVHSDTASYGSGEAFIIGGSEATTTILADGKLMYKEGIYIKPSSGTGAGTRKDANWDTAYADRNKWNGGSTGLNAATGRASLGLGSAATSASTAFATSAQGTKADTAHAWGDHGVVGYLTSETFSSSDVVMSLSGNDIIAGESITLAGGLSYNASTNTLSQTDNNTVYTHPTFNGDDFSIDTGALTGATVISDLDINITTNSEGHVTDANATVATRNLTLANLGYTGATNANYITNNNQLTNGAGYLTAHPSITQASNVNNSNGTVIQDLTFDSNGHVTATGSVNLDSRYYTETEINTGNITTSGTWTFNGVVNGLYHSVEEDHYYFDDYNGRRNVNAFLKTQYSDIVKFRAIGAVEYWNGSAWVDGSSQLNNVKNLLDGRKDTNWYVPSTYYKFRFTVTSSTSWPTMSLIGVESSWTGSSYPGFQMLVEELQSDNSWLTRVTADFTSSNGVGNWGTMFKADTALHTGRGSQTYSTRITIDFDGWTPSNSSYNTIPLQNIFIYSNFSGIANNDYHNLLNYDRHVTAPNKLYITTTDTNTDSTTALVLNGTEVEKRTLGSLAFDSTTLGTAASSATTDFAAASHNQAWSTITGTPTTIAGYGITDALQIGTTATTALAGNTAIPVSGTDFDPVGTDNSTDVTLVTTSHDYLSLSGQAITLGAINLDDIYGGTTAGFLKTNASGVVSIDTSTYLTGIGANTVSITELDVTDGTNGQVLTTDGNGNLSFATVSTSSGTDLNYYLDGITRTASTDTLVFSVNGADDQSYTFGSLAFDSTTLGTAATAATGDFATAAQGSTADSALQPGDADLTPSWVPATDPSYLTSVAFSDLTTTPTTIAGYGITDALEIGTTATTALAGNTSIPVSGTDFDPAGTDNSTDVTLASVTGNYLSISGQEITAGTVPVALGGTGATTAADARTNLGVDAAGTDNSTDVTLVTTNHDYLSISGQAITLGSINLDDINGGTTAGILTTNTSGVISIDTNTYLTSYTESGNITTADSATNVFYAVPFVSTTAGSGKAVYKDANGFYYNPSTNNLSVGLLDLSDYGTAAAPAIRWSGDGDTGIFSGGSNSGIIGFSTQGTERMRINASGAVTLSNYGAGFLKTDANGLVSVDTTSYSTFDGAYSSLTGTPTLDNYVEWYLSGDADTQDITSGKWVKFEGASSITGLGTEVSPYIVDLSGINTDTQYTAGAGVTLSGTEFNVNSDLTGVVSSMGIDSNDKYVIKATTHEWSLDGTLEMRLSSDGVLDVDGDVVAFSTVTNSDRRLKTDIETIENASEKVSKLRGVSYTWDHGKRKGQRDIGLIAQEVEEVVPEVVSEGQLLDGTTAKRVDYAKLVGLLIESNKELQAQVNELKDRLDAITK